MIALMCVLAWSAAPAFAADAEKDAPAASSVPTSPAPDSGKSPPPAASAPAPADIGGVNECPDGKARCAPLKDTASKYRRCMLLVCLNTEKAAEQKAADTSKSKKGKERDKKDKKDKGNAAPASESAPLPPGEGGETASSPATGKAALGVGPIAGDAQAQTEQTCDNGLRKCNPLREVSAQYWMCMTDTCSNKDEVKKDPNCRDGRNLCRDLLSEYQRCVKLMCKSGKACPEGEQACGVPLARYWDCVNGSCLGDIEKYREMPATSTTPAPSTTPATPGTPEATHYKTAPGPDGKLRRVYKIGDPTMPVLGVAKKFAYPPAGITQKDWHSIDVPQEVRVTNDILQRFECRNRSAIVTCLGDHVGTCACSDGTVPVSKAQIKEKGHTTTFSGAPSR